MISQPDERAKLRDELDGLLASGGAKAYIAHLNSLEGEDFAKRYEMLMEYFRPEADDFPEGIPLSN